MSLIPAVSSTTPPPAALPAPLALALAAVAPVAIGGVLVLKSGAPSPLVGAPAIALGVAAATSPALYIALAALGDAPPLRTVARALVAALAAFGIALCGLVLPAAFLALSSLSSVTAVAVVSAALGGAAVLGLWRLALELSPESGAGRCVLAVWAMATLGIAGRMWIDLAREVLS